MRIDMSWVRSWFRDFDREREKIVPRLDEASEGNFSLQVKAMRQIQDEVGAFKELDPGRVVERIHELRRKQTKNAA